MIKITKSELICFASCFDLGQNEAKLGKVVTYSKNKLSVLKHKLTALKTQIQCFKNKLFILK